MNICKRVNEWIKQGHSDLNSKSSWWCPQKQDSPFAPTWPRGLSSQACAQYCPFRPTVSSSPIREQVKLAGHGDALFRVYSLLHNEHFHLLMAHLDRLGAQALLAATKMKGGR